VVQLLRPGAGEAEMLGYLPNRGLACVRAELRESTCKICSSGCSFSFNPILSLCSVCGCRD
jgi:hypothetical protein